MNEKIIKSVKRPQSDIAEQFEKLGVATIHESMDKDTLMDRSIRPIIEGKAIAGPAITALNIPGDNLAIHIGLSLAEEGDVLVTSFLGTKTYNAIWGELATCTAIGKKVKGVVADGAVRDIKSIREMEFPVWSSSVFARGSTKTEFAGINVPVVCGGVEVNPGDIIVADDDGVIVVPIEEAELILQKALIRAEKEAKAKEQLLTGISTFEFFGMDAILSNKK